MSSRAFPVARAGLRLAAAMVDGAVIAEMRRIIGTPEVAARVIAAQGVADLIHPH